MLLFLMFLGFSLMLITGAGDAYSRISGSFKETFSSSAAVRYISNKLRSSVGSEVRPDGKGIVIDCGEMYCIIYSQTGGLYEKYTGKNVEPEFTDGEMIFARTYISIADEGDFYRISAEAGDDLFTAYCRVQREEM